MLIQLNKYGQIYMTALFDLKQNAITSFFKVFLITIGLLTIGITTTLGQQIYQDLEYYELQKANKAVRPKSKFKFNKKRNIKKIDFTKIDTNAVYIKINSDSTFTFIRFFKDALFESGPYMSKPNDQELENLTYGVFRCYTMTRKGLLLIASPQKFSMDSRWIYYFGTIYNDRIEYTHYHMSLPVLISSPGHFYPPWKYIKQSVDFKNRSYQWK